MDGENNGKPYQKRMIWRENSTIFGNTHILVPSTSHFVIWLIKWLELVISIHWLNWLFFFTACFYHQTKIAETFVLKGVKSREGPLFTAENLTEWRDPYGPIRRWFAKKRWRNGFKYGHFWYISIDKHF